jgi:predicted DCC family thiol-disulfide oxidoreductase YuxK
MLNIGFLTLLPVYVVFAPWERIVPHLPRGLLRSADRLASLKGVFALLILFLPLYLVEDRVSVDTAANAFSHLGIAFESFGSLDYNWFLSVTLHSLAALIALTLAGLPQPLPGRSAPIPGTAAKRVVFFDGVCNLCNGFVDFLIQRDRERGLMFASLQSQPGQAVSRAVPAAVPDTYYSVFLLDTDGQIYERSDAILKTLESLGGKYRLVRVLWLVPRPLRDIVYRAVSRWRYHIFGMRQSCRIPTAQERATFVPDFDTYSERAIFRA